MPEIEKSFKTYWQKALVNDYKEVFTKDVTQINTTTTMKVSSKNVKRRFAFASSKEKKPANTKIPQSSLEVPEYTAVLPVDILEPASYDDKQFTLSNFASGKHWKIQAQFKLWINGPSTTYRWCPLSGEWMACS